MHKAFMKENTWAYDWTNAALHTTELVGGGLGLYEFITATKPNFISKGLSKTAAPLLAAQAVSQVYEWSRDSAIYSQLDSIQKTYQSMTELRNFHVDQIVNKLMDFDPETQTIDELRYSIILSLNHYPIVYTHIERALPIRKLIYICHRCPKKQ
jgi:hypothetical protein